VITDYSGVYFDAVAIDKPIIFIPYDIEEYASERGFMYDYYDNTPGPKIDSQKELIEHFKHLLNGDDRYHTAREKIRDRFFEHKDGQASKRLTHFITTIVDQ